jgi:hypothetical protein
MMQRSIFPLVLNGSELSRTRPTHPIWERLLAICGVKCDHVCVCLFVRKLKRAVHVLSPASKCSIDHEGKSGVSLPDIGAFAVALDGEVCLPELLFS